MESVKKKFGYFKYIKNFARGGYIIGCILTLFVLLNALFGGEVGFVFGEYTFTGAIGALLIVLFVPVFMMIVWLLIGTISYFVSLFISWCFSFF